MLGLIMTTIILSLYGRDCLGLPQGQLLALSYSFRFSSGGLYFWTRQKAFRIIIFCLAKSIVLQIPVIPISSMLLSSRVFIAITEGALWPARLSCFAYLL